MVASSWTEVHYQSWGLLVYWSPLPEFGPAGRLRSITRAGASWCTEAHFQSWVDWGPLPEDGLHVGLRSIVSAGACWWTEVHYQCCGIEAHYPSWGQLVGWGPLPVLWDWKPLPERGPPGGLRSIASVVRLRPITRAGACWWTEFHYQCTQDITKHVSVKYQRNICESAREFGSGKLSRFENWNEMRDA